MIDLPWDGVIFDVDGTLVQSASLHFDAFNAAARRQGAEMPRVWYDSRKGLDRTGLTTAFAAQIAAETGRDLDIDALSRDSLEITIDRAERLVTENPPVARFARSLHGHRPLAVGSNAETPVVEAMLRGAGLLDLFDAIVTVSDTGRAKPDPAIFLRAAGRIAVPPARSLVLEDSDEGLQAAARAGMTGWDVRDPGVLTRIAAVIDGTRDARPVR